MVEIAQRTRQFGRIGRFSPEELVVALEGLWEVTRVNEGAVLFNEGDETDALYFLEEGEIRLDVSTDDIDTDAVLGFVTPGELIGDVGVVSGAPRAATATGVTQCQLRRIDVATIRRIESEDPQRAVRVHRLLAESVAARLQEANSSQARTLYEGADDPVVNSIMQAASDAQRLFSSWADEDVDGLLRDLGRTVAAQAEELGEATVAETGLGVAGDKAEKIRFASLGVLGFLLGKPASGILSDDSKRQVTSLAAPVGVVFGVTPITEPVSTFMNKVLIALKGRNAIVVSPHSGSVRTATKVYEIVLGVLRDHGAPEGIVQLAGDRASRQRTTRFLSHPTVGMILATGGENLVRAAYRSGRPAIGVGPGNAPVWIASDADVEHAAKCVIESKSFDNSLICGAEQHLIIDESVCEEFVKSLQREGTRVLTEDEREVALGSAFTPEGRLTMEYVGQPAKVIAQALNVEVDDSVRMLAFWDNPMSPSLAGSTERLAPIITLYKVSGEDEAISLAERLLMHEGIGHTAVIHSESDDRVLRFAQAVPVSRVLVNVPASQGCGGALTGLVPSMTLGCGTFGGNSTTDNVGVANLLNIKRVARPFLGNVLPMKRLAK